jgi:hypothetical protein
MGNDQHKPTLRHCSGRESIRRAHSATQVLVVASWLIPSACLASSTEAQRPVGFQNDSRLFWGLFGGEETCPACGPGGGAVICSWKVEASHADYLLMRNGGE